MTGPKMLYTHPESPQAVTHDVHPAEPAMSDASRPGWLSFSIRDLLWLTALVAVVLWSKYGSHEKPGRYTQQMNPNQGQTFILDTATGQCWLRDVNGGWTDATPPAIKK